MISLLSVIFWTKAVSVALSGQSWVREIEIEVCQPLSQEGWCDSLPTDAYQVERQRRIRAYEQRPCPMSSVIQLYVVLIKGMVLFEKSKNSSARLFTVEVKPFMTRYSVDRWQAARTYREGQRS